MYRPNYWQPKDTLDYSEGLSLFKHLNSDELKEMLNDEDKIEEMLKDLEMVKKWENEKEMLLASNKSLAEFNLAEEPRLTEGRERLCGLHSEAKSLLEELESKQSNLDSLSGNQSLETLLALLQTSTAESEEESEELAEKFLGGDMDIDEFLELYLKLRSAMHLRRVKADKLKYIITSRTSTTPSAGVQKNWLPYVPYPVNPVQGPMATPYPPYINY